MSTTTPYASADEALSVIRQRQTMISQMEQDVANLKSALLKLKLEQNAEVETWRRKHLDTLDTRYTNE